jgi:hypothetical protein
MSASIFISYASQDGKVASTLCKALEARGFKCWISSRDILAGENFQVSIVRAIRTARMMLLVFTANSNNSEEMNKELALASQHKLIVVPLRIEDVTPNDAFAYEFATRQWIDFFSDWETAMNQLSERIGNALAPADGGIAEALAPVAAVAAAAASASPSVALAEPPPPKPAPVEPPAPAAKAPAPAAEPTPVVELMRPDARPAPSDLARAKQAAPAAKPATTAAAKPPAGAAAPKVLTAPAQARKSPVGVYVAIGLIVLVVVGVGLLAPSLFGHKPPSSAAVAAAAAHHAPPAAQAAAPKPLVTAVAPAAIAAPPAATNAAAPTNALAAADGSAKPVHKRATHAASYSSGSPAPARGETDVPF